jgi:hypothetical protein
MTSARWFDTVINCSTVEHVGLPGRYGGPSIPDGDLEACSACADS